jgi:hypothetical protein
MSTDYEYHRIIDAEDAAPGEDGQATTASTAIREVVHQYSSGQFDFRSAVEYGWSAVPQLVEMLNSSEEESNAPTIIKILGLVGDDKTVGLLSSYIGAGSSQISPLEYRSKMAAIISVGYLANKHYMQQRDEERSPAIEFLTSLTMINKVGSIAGNWSLEGQARRSRDALCS